MRKELPIPDKLKPLPAKFDVGTIPTFDDFKIPSNAYNYFYVSMFYLIITQFKFSVTNTSVPNGYVDDIRLSELSLCH